MNGPNNPIGWCDYTWNPVKGKCPVACPYCYARRIYDRFHYDPTIRFDAKEFSAVEKLKKPARIFVGSTIELFGERIPKEWIFAILEQARKHPQHTFQFLTKNPAWMVPFNFPFNCWCGTTVTTFSERGNVYYLSEVQTTKRFVSFEPLHGDMAFPYFPYLNHIDWIIIGAETGNCKGKIVPEEKWIANILGYADSIGIPIFMKDNLKPYWHGELRQEFPG
jgi:protein gp37